MQDALKFVSGAIGKDDRKYLRIRSGTVQAYNGLYSLHSPIELDVDCNPDGNKLIKSIGKETVSCNLTKKGRLSVKSGQLRAYIECVDFTPANAPEGVYKEIDGKQLLKAFRCLQPLINTEATHVWSTGLITYDQFAYATNNTVAARYDLGFKFITANIPQSVIAQILKLKEIPIAVQATANSVTFHFEKSRWLKTALITTKPPNLDATIDLPSHQQQINKEIYIGIKAIQNHLDEFERVIFKENTIRTHLSNEKGAIYQIPNLNIEGVWQAKALLSIESMAQTIDLTQYPKPCVFEGENIKGVIVGLRN